MKHFWQFARNEDTGQRELWFEGVIASESWFNDDITPAMFKEELFAGSGPITLHINSPGGDCVAASQIYTLLMDYPDDVNVQIDGIAASAASVIAMAGTRVSMSPTSMILIHNPFTEAMGDSDEMRKAIQLLDEVKESIINAYQIKTGLSRTRLSHLMDSETWMSALKAKELGFCDEILYTDGWNPDAGVTACYSFERKPAVMCLMNRVIAAMPASVPTPEPVTEAMPEPPVPKPAAGAETVTEPSPIPVIPDNRVRAADLEKRLLLLK